MTYLLWHDLTKSARNCPDRPAVAWRGRVLTYQQLEEQSTRLAAFLQRQGIGPRTRVGLYLPKCPESIVSMLAVLKAGAAYVPVDPHAPPARASFVLADCDVKGIITTTGQLQGLREHAKQLDHVETIILVDEERESDLPALLKGRIYGWANVQDEGRGSFEAPDALETDPAYVLYTSGSTGYPKGVVISHRNARTFVEWGAETFRVQPDDRLANHAPLHFDLSVFDIYAALRVGACVVMVPHEAVSFPMELASWMENERISIWYSVPSALTRLLLHGHMERFHYQDLRAILFAGDVFPIKYLKDIMSKLPHVRFYNLYGPTETNVCTYYPVPPLSDGDENLPIGRACRNTEVFAVDEKGTLVPPGGVGELLVRGPSVMLGYWGLAEKTAQNVIHNPLQLAYREHVYRTGDYVRLRDDGNYIFCGRRDNMVKSRGYRIELGEIEHVLNQHELVGEAIVFAVPDEELGSRLKSVIVPLQHSNGLTKTLLQAYCLARLAKYMVPEEFVIREDLPRTSTGKTDRITLRAELGWR